MHLRETTSFDVGVEQAFAARIDRSVRERACQESGATAWTVRVDPDGATTTVVVERTMPPSVPEFVRRFVGNSIVVRQTERWSAPDERGARRADVKVTIGGQPAKMVGSTVIEPSGDGSAETVEGDVTVSVPFIGRRVEPEIVKVIVAALRIDQRLAVERLRATGPRSAGAGEDG
jgi:hypothetical protein